MMKDDTSTNFQELKQAVAELVSAKGWEENTQSTKNVSMSLAAEVGELMQPILWASPSEVSDFENSDEGKEHISGELADIVVNVFYLANHLNLDISTAVRKKIEHSFQRFPDKEIYTTTSKIRRKGIKK